MISQASIEEIQARVRLTDLVAEVVELKPRGASLIGLCPFHNEKTPSFHVRETDNRYHCFGCGASGDVITFVMERNGLPFPDAVEYLAQRAGIPLKYEGKAATPERGLDRRKLFAITALAQRFFRAELDRAPQVVTTYLAQRGLDAAAVALYGVGFAPTAWGSLTESLRSRRVPDELLLALGLARRNSRGELYDSFRGRLIFPIFMDQRRIAGFGGRLIPGLQDPGAADTAPKYINSPESPIYQKSSVLYGIPQALTAIKEKREIFLVEGYLDVISLQQAGVGPVVATCGTAVTEQHVRRLESLTKNVHLLFDGDAAGLKAAARSFQVLADSKAEVAAWFLPPGEDPDSFARRHGDQTGAALAELPHMPLLECYVDSLIAEFGVKQAVELGAGAKGQVAEQLAQQLSKVSKKIVRAEYIKAAAFKLNIATADLADLVENGPPRRRKMAEPEGETVSVEIAARHCPIGELPRVDQQMLLAVMAGKEQFLRQVLESSEICDFLKTPTLNFIRRLAEILAEAAQREAGQVKEEIRQLLLSGGDSWVAHWRQAYAMIEDREVSMEKVFAECCRSITRLRLQQLAAENDRMLKVAASDEERAALVKSSMDLQRRIRAL